MKRNGLILAGGIIAIIRGSLGTLAGFAGLSTIGEIERFAPGYGLIFAFEMGVSIAVLIAGIYAVTKANDPQSAGTIRGWGIAIIVAGIIDFLWGIAVFGGTAEVIASGLGSIFALMLIGSLLMAGARRLQTLNS